MAALDRANRCVLRQALGLDSVSSDSNGSEQILLEDDQYQRLRMRSKATGTGIGELVRQAVDAMYGERDVTVRLQALNESFGSAAAGDFDDLDGEAYVDRVRRGLGRRLRDLDTA
jgi:hypothetical protein